LPEESCASDSLCHNQRGGAKKKNSFEALVKLGIETKTKDLQVFAGGAKKGRIGMWALPSMHYYVVPN